MTLTRSHSFLLAVPMLGGLYAASLLIARSEMFARAPELLGASITVDLTLSATAIVWLTLVRRGHVPWWALLPVFFAGLGTAWLILPASGQRAVDLALTAWAFVEIALVVVLLTKLRRLLRRVRILRGGGMERVEAFEQALGEILHAPLLASALVAEVAIVVSGMTGWFRRAPAPSPDTFTVHRERAWSVIAATLGFMTIVETVGVHVLLARVTPIGAWLATATSIYGLLWLAGDAHALRLSRVRVTADAVSIEVGLRWRVAIPRDAIASVTRVEARLPAARELLAAELLWPGVLLELRAPVVARGLFGRRKTVSRVSLSVDDRARFIAALTPPSAET